MFVNLSTIVKNRLRYSLWQLALLTLAMLMVDVVWSQGAFESPVNTRVEFSESIEKGNIFNVNVFFEIKDGWHLYANPKGPGTGLPLTLRIKELPNNSVKVNYPKGDKFDIPGLNEWVFAWHNKVKVSIEVFIDDSFKLGEQVLTLQVNGLVCKDACVPLRSESIVKFNVIDSSSNTNISSSVNEVSSSLGEKGSEIVAQDNKLQVVGGLKDLLSYLFLGFIAGIILNFMPCVLPVLSLKVMSLLNLNKGRAWKSVFFYTLGILVVFAVLSTLMAFAKKMWGQQFQEETFLVVMGLFVIIFIFSLFDVFYLSAGVDGLSVNKPQSEGWKSDFLKGVLATLLATPCSGPFLGGTLAWASQQTPAIIFTTYMSVGFGLAFPFVLLGLIPSFRSFFPKPGDWMVRLKEGSAFLMLGTLVYLLYLITPQMRMLSLGLFVFWAFCLWLYAWSGKWIRLIAVLCIVGTLSGFHYYKEGSTGAVYLEPEISFKRTMIDEALDKGSNVIVDFTADWCPNCKLNEKLVLYTSEVQTFFKKNNIVFLKADLTRENPEAQGELERLGGKSIPFLSFYQPGPNKRVATLPDVYTKDYFLEFLEKHMGINE